jgi:hypothetical protein
MKNILIYTFIIIGTCLLLYGTYWVVKHVSYFFFYEDMVKETIRELVKPEYLIIN